MALVEVGQEVRQMADQTADFPRCQFQRGRRIRHGLIADEVRLGDMVLMGGRAETPRQRFAGGAEQRYRRAARH